MKNGHFSSITAHLNTGSQYIWPTEENSCSLFSQHQLKNAQMLHSDIRNWGKNILLLQKKHMMTKLSGCHTGFCAGGGKHWCTWPVSFWKDVRVAMGKTMSEDNFGGACFGTIQ